MQKYRYILSVSVPVILAAFTAYAAGQNAAVHVEISNIRNSKGDILCHLFSSAEGFPEAHAKAFRELHAAINADHAVCDFKDVPAGTYAFIALHDENLNEKMDKNVLGIPQEGYGASNNVHPLFSAPDFKDAAFGVAAGSVTPLKVKMEY